MLLGVLAGVGIAIGAGGLVFLLVGEVTPIFGFREGNFRAEVIAAGVGPAWRSVRERAARPRPHPPA